MYLEPRVEERQPQLERAQERFLRAVLSESAADMQLSSEQKAAAMRALNEYFSEWMSSVEQLLSYIRHQKDAPTYFDAYASWLEHLANVRLAQAIEEDVFDAFERPLDEVIALRARLFRAVAMNYADWPSLIQDLDPRERSGSALLSMVNHLRGFFGRRAVTSHMHDSLRKVGLIEQGGAIAPLPIESTSFRSGTELAVQAWDEGRAAWEMAMQVDQGVSPEDRMRMELFFRRLEDFVERAGDVIIPPDILEAIRDQSHKIVALARRRIELEARLVQVKPEEQQAFEQGLRSLVAHLTELQADQKLFLDIRDLLEEAQELGVVPSLRLPAAITARQYFTRLQHRG